MLKINIKSSIKAHKLLLSILIFTLIFAVLSLNFSLYQYRESQRQKALSSHATEYKILLEGENYNLSNIKLIFDKYNNNIESGYAKISNVDFPLRAYYKGCYDVSHGEPIESNNDVVIGSQPMLDGKSIGDSFVIIDKTFVVSGMRVGGEYNEILLADVSEDMKVSELNIKFKNTPSKSFLKDFYKTSTTYFLNCEVEYPESVQNISGDTYHFRSSIIVLLISLANINFIIMYLLNKRKQSINVMFLCGATKKKIIFSITAEFLIYTLIAATIGNGLFYIVLDEFLLIETKISLLDILSSYIVLIILTFMVFIINQRNFTTKLKEATIYYYE